MNDKETLPQKSEEIVDSPDVNSNMTEKKQIFIPMKNPEPNDTNLSKNLNSESAENPQFKNQNENLRENHNKYFNLQVNKMAIMNSIKDQKATLILQKILMGMNSEQIKSIVHELKGEYRKLIFDKYGNFFCKDLFKICSQKDRSIILNELYPTLSEDCKNNYATHPIQTLIEFSYTEEDFKLILYSFNDYDKIFSATIDPNGSYVIQKIVDRIPERFRADFNKIFSSFIETACQKKYGIVAVKKFLDCTVNDSIIKTVMNLIRNKFFDLAKDQYGNYLIQFLLEKWAFFKDGQEIKNLVEKNFDILMKTKYSSFICECYNKLFNKKSQNEGKDQEKNNQKISP
jgi:hypothetical protein